MLYLGVSCHDSVVAVVIIDSCLYVEGTGSISLSDLLKVIIFTQDLLSIFEPIHLEQTDEEQEEIVFNITGCHLSNIYKILPTIRSATL